MRERCYKQLSIPEDTAWDRKKGLVGRFKSWMYDKYEYTLLYDFFDKFWFTPVYNVKNGLKNFKNWYKVIWSDRNWDSYYIYTVLERKLELQREELVNANRFVGVEMVNRDLTICLNLINRIKNDYYNDEYFDYHDIEMNFIPVPDRPKKSTIEFETLWEKYDEYLNKYPSSVRAVKKIKNPLFDITEKKRLAMMVGIHNQKKAEELLFKILKERIKSFWD